MGPTPIPPRPAKGWGVYNLEGNRIGTVRRVQGDNRVVWTSSRWGHRVISTKRWEDVPAGTFRPPECPDCAGTGSVPELYDEGGGEGYAACPTCRDSP